MIEILPKLYKKLNLKLKTLIFGVKKVFNLNLILIFPLFFKFKIENTTIRTSTYL